MLQLVEVSY